MDGLVSNPFNPPQPGSDDPHQGVDLADRLPGSQVTLTGRIVQAALAGKVAGVIEDRFPYGNAILIESQLEWMTTSEAQALLPTPLATRRVNPALTCPEVDPPYPAGTGANLYILYAHLEEPPSLTMGQMVGCGEALGAVGKSGNALNPHLHLEARVGPAQAQFFSMGHYDNRVSAEEMGLYCIWRVSGVFQLVDPLALLRLKP
jgi:murein DD-endopeptidase MepM/ murein hydrolase activator NlpD